MKNKILRGCVLCLFLSTSFFTIPSTEAGSITLVAPSAVLLDGQTQQILYAKAAYTQRAPASTTKLVAMMVVLDHLSTSKKVKIPSGMHLIQPSKLGLKTGEIFYVRDLVKACLIKSANDAAEALAIVTAGSRAKFAKLMNAKVKSIGAKNSNFVNPNGLPASGQYSTAYDLARIAMAASKYSLIVSSLKTKSATIRSLGGRKFILRNGNKMLWRSGGVIGKTGWTRSARHCFSGRIKSHGRVIYVGLMGSQKRQYLWSDLKRIAAIPSGKMPKPIVSAVKKPSREKTFEIQQALGEAGYFKGNATGFFGKRTLAAVKKFQRAQRITADGIVGPQTWEKLEPYLVAAAASSKQETIKLQKALEKAGFFKGTATGYFGKQTRAAVLNFQRSKGLAADGVAGPNTLEALKPYFVGSEESSEQETLKIQEALKKAGFFKGTPAGVYGAQTRAAVRSFQEANGLTVDGIAGPKTMEKLKDYL